MSLKNIGNIINAGTDFNKLKNAVNKIGDLDKAVVALNSVKGLDNNLKSAVLVSSSLDITSKEAAKAALGINKAGDSITQTEGKLKSFKSASTGLFGTIKNGISSLGTAIKSNISGSLITGAIGALIAGIAIYVSQVEDAKEKVEKAVNSGDKYKQTKTDVESLKTELETIGTQIDQLNAKQNLSFTDQSELNNLQAQSAELEHQIELKERLAKIEQSQAARDAKEAFNSLSARNAIDKNGEGTFTNFLDAIEGMAAWKNDILGLTESDPLLNPGGSVGTLRDLFSDDEDIIQYNGTPDKIILQRIESAKKAQEELKKLQDSQNESNYDAIQRKIDEQQNVVDNYATNLQSLYTEMQDYTSSFNLRILNETPVSSTIISPYMLSLLVT